MVRYYSIYIPNGNRKMVNTKREAFEIASRLIERYQSVSIDFYED